jgi:signal transduction histidine kinase
VQILGPTQELIRNAHLGATHLSHLKIICRNAQRLLRLVNDIMNFAQAESGMMKATFQATYIGPYTLDLASTFSAAAKSSGLEYTVESLLSPSQIVYIDREKVLCTLRVV